MSKQIINLLAVGPVCALITFGGSYAGLAGQLPAHMARHVGADSVGYSSTSTVMGVIAGIAVLCFGLGAWIYMDLRSVGHWYAGPKAAVVSFLGAGYAVVGLGIAMLLAMLSGISGPEVIGVGLLGLVLVFGAAAGVLGKVLPPAQRENLGHR